MKKENLSHHSSINSIMQKRIEEILQNVLTAILIISKEEKQILFANKTAEKLLQKSTAELYSSKYSDSVRSGDEEKNPLWNQMQNSENRKSKIILDDKSELSVIRSVREITYNGIPCLLETIINMTAHESRINNFGLLIRLRKELSTQVTLKQKLNKICTVITESINIYDCEIQTRTILEQTNRNDINPLKQNDLQQIISGETDFIYNSEGRGAFSLLDEKGTFIGLLSFKSVSEPVNSELDFLRSAAYITSHLLAFENQVIELQKARLETQKAFSVLNGNELRIRQLKEKENMLAEELGRKEIFSLESGDDHRGEADLIEHSDSVLSLVEEAEIARRELIETNDQLFLIKNAVDHSSDAIAISTILGGFFYINKTFTDMFGYSIKLLARLSLDSLLEVESVFQDALDSAVSGILWQNRVKMIDKDDTFISIYLRASPFSDDKQNILGVIWNFTDISKSVSNEEKIREYTERIEKDLEEQNQMMRKAVLLQKNLIHDELPLMQNINIQTMFMPCESLGGDFFRIQKGISEQKLVIILGDCTDHGLKASMDASLLTSLVDQNLSVLYEDNRTDLFLNTISREYMKIADDDQFPTMFVMVVNIYTGESYYSNANSELPFLIRSNTIKRIKNARGLHIGYFPEPDYKRNKITLQKDDRLIFYSDALIDIKTHGEQRLGYEGLAHLIEESLGHEEGLFRDFIKMVRQKNGGFPLEDDTTLILLDFIAEEKVVKEFSDMDEWRVILDLIRGSLRKMSFENSEIEQISIALDEMCLNAFYHGNKEDTNKKVHIEGTINGYNAEFSITDEGEGFDPEDVPDPVVNIQDIISRGDFEEFTHGRGIRITRDLLDFVEYSKKGNHVKIQKTKGLRKTLYQSEIDKFA